MKILGITAEYNPFHKGHLFHLNEAKSIVQPDYTVVALSGSFVQRGEPALLDKWTRSRCAIDGGADLVAEIPFTFSCSRAPYYAGGAVDLLVAMGATHIAFGCEAEDAKSLEILAEALDRRSGEIQELVAVKMKEGISRAKATEAAVKTLLGQAVSELMLSPNNILAIEYIKRINWWRNQGREIELVPIKRKGSGYNDINEEAGFAGATEIRRLVAEGKIAECEAFAPKSTMEALRSEFLDPEVLKARKDRLFELIRYQLIRDSEEDLVKIYGIGEGIENRMKKAAIETSGYDELVDYLVSKRYSASAVRRMLVNILMGIAGDDGPEGKSPEYIRVLAAGKKGRELIKRAKKEELFSLPIITNINKNERGSELSRDVKASDIYNIIVNRNLYDYSDHVVTPYIEI